MHRIGGTMHAFAETPQDDRRKEGIIGQIELSRRLSGAELRVLDFASAGQLSAADAEATLEHGTEVPSPEWLPWENAPIFEFQDVSRCR